MTTINNVNVGASPNDGSGDLLRDGFIKINNNTTNLNNDKVETSDYTDADIKTKYENNADTNAFDDAEQSKLAGIEVGAEANNISDSNATDLTDAGNTVLHFHAEDRDRTNHTGTQTASTVTNTATTISDSTDVGVQITENSTSVSEQCDSGHVSWTGTGDYWSINIGLGTFTLLRGGMGRIDGKEVDFLADVAGSQTLNLNLGETIFAFIDANGDLQKSTTFSPNVIMLFEVWRCATGANIFVVKENHPYAFDSQVSASWHNVFGVSFHKDDVNSLVGARVTTGTGTLVTDRQIKSVGNGTFEDHGLTSEITDSGGIGINFGFPFLNVGGKWECAGMQQEILMEYNLLGVRTAISSGKFGVFKFFVTKDDLNDVNVIQFALMSDAEFSNQGAADSEIVLDQTTGSLLINSPTNELKTLEMARLGYAVVQNNADGGQIISVTTDLETATAGGGAGAAGGDASTISTDITNFDKNLSGSDTSVQIALETIDEFDLGQIDTASNVGAGTGTVVKGVTARDLEIKSLIGGTNVTITNNTDDITIDVPAAGGETNTASNVGLEGVGIFKQKTLVDLEFKKLNASSTKISIVDDITNSDIDFDVVEANIDHQNLSGAGLITHATLDAHVANSSNPHFVTQTQVGLGNVDNTSDVDKPVSTAQQTALNLKTNNTDSVTSVAGTPTGGDRISKIISLTTAEYNAASKIADTLYIITDA